MGCSEDSPGQTNFSGSQTDGQTSGPGSSSGTAVPTTSAGTEPTGGSNSATDSNATTDVPTSSTTDGVTSTIDPSSTTGDGTTSDGTTDGTTGDTTTGDTTTGNGCLETVPDPACAGDAGLIFVSTPPTGGSDLNSGTAKDDPVATLAHAMELAAACPDLCDIVVSAGTYQKSITLTSGVSIYGGYTPKTFVYDLVPNVTIIDGTEERAVIAQGLTLTTLLSGFTIKGKSFGDDGKSSYAVWVKDVADDLLQIDKCTIQAGAGGLGTDGPNGTKGADGATDPGAEHL